jgi:hypothetical protein
MKPILDLVFRKYNKAKSREYLTSLKNILALKSQFTEIGNSLDKATKDYISENYEDLYLSVKDLAGLARDNKFNITDIISKAKHVAEITGQDFSHIDVSAIIEDEHVVLCADTDSCEKHKHSYAEKVKIVMVR